MARRERHDHDDAAAGRFDAVLFDLDGTLVDSLADIAAACNAALRDQALPPLRPADYAPLAGGGARALLTRALQRQLRAAPSDHQLRRAVAVKQQFDARNAAPLARPFAGVPDVLRAVAAANVPMAVLSNKAQPVVRAAVARLFADVPFVAVAGATDAAPLKPHPHAALRLLRAHLPAAAPHRCALVGDTDVDVRTALAAGLTPIAVHWGFRAAPQLSAAGARLHAAAPADLLPLLLRRP